MFWVAHEFVLPFVSHCSATHFLLLVQKKVSKGKGHPDTAPAQNAGSLRHAAATGCGQNSRRFGDAQTGWPHRRSAPDTLRPCASRRSTRGPNTGTARPARGVGMGTERKLGPWLRSGRARLRLCPTKIARRSSWRSASGPAFVCIGFP